MNTYIYPTVLLNAKDIRSSSGNKLFTSNDSKENAIRKLL